MSRERVHPRAGNMKPGCAMLVFAGLLLSVPGATAQEALTNVVDDCSDFYSQRGKTNLHQAIGVAIRKNLPVTFKCGGPVTIGTQPGRPGLRITQPVVIDGGGTVTLDASNIIDTEPLFVAGSPTAAGSGLTLKNISIKFGMQKHANPSGAFISHFSDNDTLPPSVIYAEMDTTLDNVTITESARPVLVNHHNLTIASSQFTLNGVPPVIETDGTLTVQDSAFVSNGGYAIFGRGPTNVAGSKFISNGSGGMSVLGPLRVERTLFQSNVDGIQALSPPTITVDRSVFDHNNRALWTSVDGGDDPARWVHSVAISHSTFKGNGQFKSALVGGAAVHFVSGRHDFSKPGFVPNPLKVDLKYNNFIRNVSSAVKAEVDPAFHSALSVTGGTFDYNIADFGGAIVWLGGSITVVNALFKGNEAQSGSAIWARKLEAGKSSIANTLIVEGVSKANGSAIDLESASLFNVTLARNTGGAIKFLSPDAGSRIVNSIFSDNSGGNCSGISAGMIKGGNLQFGAKDCPGVQVADPVLDRFYAPDIGSVAARSGDVSACRAPPIDGWDIIRQSRREGPTCSSGAFEKQPVEAAINAAKRKNEVKATQTCDNGMVIPKGTACPGVFRSCGDGSIVPEDGVCPQPAPHRCSTGMVLGGNDICPPVPCMHGGERPDGGVCPAFKCPDGQVIADTASCPARQCRLGVTVPNGQPCPMLPCSDGKLHPGDQECPRKQCNFTNTTVPDGQRCPPHFCQQEGKFEDDDTKCFVVK